MPLAFDNPDFEIGVEGWKQFSTSAKTATNSFQQLNEMTVRDMPVDMNIEEEKTEAPKEKDAPKDACPKLAKKPGHFWSSCPDCHIVRREYHAKLRQRGEHPEDALIQNATTKAMGDARK